MRVIVTSVARSERVLSLQVSPTDDPKRSLFQVSLEWRVTLAANLFTERGDVHYYFDSIDITRMGSDLKIAPIHDSKNSIAIWIVI